MKYTHHKYLIDWSIRKKDMAFQSQQKLGDELWTLSLTPLTTMRIIFKL